MTDLLKTRIRKLNSLSNKAGDCVIYIMSRDQRVNDNHSLVAAIRHSNAIKVPVIVVFNIYPDVKNRTKNQYEWMIEGLGQVGSLLKKYNIPFITTLGNAIKNYSLIENELNPAAIYFDFSPLKGARKVKNQFSKLTSTPCFIVDTHNVIPVWESSDKEEFSAFTFRPKVNKKINQYLDNKGLSFSKSDLKFQVKFIVPNKLQGIVVDLNEVLKKITATKLDSYFPVVKPGEDEAKKVLLDFIQNKLLFYSEKRNLPTEDYQSNLSAYLHFGQISSLRVALEIINFAKKNNIEIEFSTDKNRAIRSEDVTKLTKKERLQLSIEAFFEEMIVRKELCENFCFFNEHYDNIGGAKEWAIESLRKHINDRREFLYSFDKLEKAMTHDNVWNAAQKQLILTGKIHGYMRMYWAKKILEWSKTPEIAIKSAIKLNDKYSLDGYDPNGYTGIMWSICGIHDRPWPERKIFGKIRYMNYEGLKRKFNIEEYIYKVK